MGSLKSRGGTVLYNNVGFMSRKFRKKGLSIERDVEQLNDVILCWLVELVMLVDLEFENNWKIVC